MSAERRFTRRGFVATSAVSTATAGVAVLGGSGQAVFAQDAEATPVPLPAGPITDVTTDTGDWRSTNGDNTGHRVAKTTIDGSNVSTLGPAWRVNLVDAAGEPSAVTGTPIVVGELVYIQDMNSNVTAYDRASGEVAWVKTYDIGCNGPNGVTYGYGNLYFGLGESAEAAAIDAKTGDDVWRVKLSNFPEEGIRMSPVAYGGVLYISIVPLSTNTNLGARGVLHALDAQTGATLWYFDLSLNNLWGNARRNSGAGLWYAPNFDDEGNLYFGNGNAAPWPGDPDFPAGSSRDTDDNLYASTAMSIDPTTGSVRWHFQPKPFDLFDLDYQIAPMIVQANINGEDTKLAICSGKTGDVVAINADTGRKIWWTKVGKHKNDQLQQLTDEYIQVFPGGNGGVLTPPAYADGVFYCVVTNRPSWVNATGSQSHPEEPWEGEVIAIDVQTGTIMWDVHVPTFPTGSIIVANDQVITSGLDGVVRAFNRADGSQTWNFQMKAGVNAPVSIAGDELYVAAGTQYQASPDQISEEVGAEAVYELVQFKLGVGGGIVPESTPSMDMAPVDDATAVATAEAGDVEAATPVTSERDGSLSLVIEAGDLYFKPNAIAIPANNDVSVTIRNVGALQHDFVIDDPSVDSGMIASGTSEQVVLNLAPGTYQFYCTVEGHADAGMIGSITVE